MPWTLLSFTDGSVFQLGNVPALEISILFDVTVMKASSLDVSNVVVFKKMFTANYLIVTSETVYGHYKLRSFFYTGLKLNLKEHVHVKRTLKPLNISSSTVASPIP